MNKEQILNKVNILLISDNENDYKELVMYGFENISYFKSIIIANEYFEEHPEELTNFQMVIKGRQKVQRVCFGGETELDRKIYNLPHEVADIHIYDYPNETDYCYYLDNERQRTHNMKDILDYYTKQVLNDENLQKGIRRTERFTIEEPQLPSIKYPKSKKDLKILILLSGCVYTTDEESIKKHLGIDIQIEGDDNNGLGNFVIRNMGNYDIIIASNCYSKNLVEMNEEYTEQGKRKGKGLGIVGTYESDSIFYHTSDNSYISNYIGTELKTHYVICGVNAIYSDVLKEKYKIKADDRVNMASSLVEKAIIAYHEALKNINGVGLEDVVLEDFNRYSEEYEKANIQYEQDKKEYAKQVETYDNILREAKRYLANKKKGRIKSPLADLKIVETSNGIIIENYVGARKICSLTFSLNEENKNRVFFIQTLKENGILSSNYEVALFPIEKKFNIARPNEKQLSALFGIWKKMEHNLVPINAGCDEELSLSKKNKNRKISHNR